jgi:hypothetical protein
MFIMIILLIKIGLLNVQRCKTIFNLPIDTWDVSSVIWMHYMFRGSDFNHPLNSRDVVR